MIGTVYFTFTACPLCMPGFHLGIMAVSYTHLDVYKRQVLAPFSSVGNTADHRIKPDIVAVGLCADVIRTDGNQGMANGTSFASPIKMCIRDRSLADTFAAIR